MASGKHTLIRESWLNAHTHANSRVLLCMTWWWVSVCWCWLDVDSWGPCAHQSLHFLVNPFPNNCCDTNSFRRPSPFRTWERLYGAESHKKESVGYTFWNNTFSVSLSLHLYMMINGAYVCEDCDHINSFIYINIYIYIWYNKQSWHNAG